MRANVRLSLIVTAVVILSVAWRAGTTRFRTNAIVVDHREKRIIAHPRTDTIIVLAERRVQSARRLRVNDSLIVVQVGPRRLDGFQRDGRQVELGAIPWGVIVLIIIKADKKSMKNTLFMETLEKKVL